MEEIWKDIEGYEGFYQVSNLGRVKSLHRLIKFSNGGTREYPEKILKQYKANGYWVVGLNNHGKKTQVRVHRLVAEAFIPNPNNLPQVGHKDEKNFKTSNECNNNVDNLEWTTAKENSNMPTHIKNMSGKNNGFYGKHHTEETKQKLRDINNGKEGYWRNHKITDSMKENMSKNHANVSGKNNPMYGKTHSKEAKEKIAKINSKQVYCDGMIFDSGRKCADFYGVCYTTLNKVLVGKTRIPKSWPIKTLYYLNDE